MIVFNRFGVKRGLFLGSNLPPAGFFPGASKDRTRFRGRSWIAASPTVTEIAYDPGMSVVRMAIDVAEWGRRPAIAPVGRAAPFEVMPLAWGDQSRTLAAAVAASCGLRPEGFLAQLTSRPGRRVYGWGAVVRNGAVLASAPAEPDPQASSGGVILLAESTLSGQGTPRLSIPWLLVCPESRRVGMGRALVAAALGHASGLGASRVTIDTLDRWPEAVAFWRGVGFFEAEPRKILDNEQSAF